MAIIRPLKSSNNRPLTRLSKLRSWGIYMFAAIVLLYSLFLMQLIYKYHGSSLPTSSMGEQHAGKVYLNRLQQRHDNSASELLYEPHGEENDQPSLLTSEAARPPKAEIPWSIPKLLGKGQSLESWFRTERVKMKQISQGRTQQRRQRTQGSLSLSSHDGATLPLVPTEGKTNKENQLDDATTTTTTTVLSAEAMPYILCGGSNNNTTNPTFNNNNTNVITSQSTVLITGIFSSSIGVNLALYLYTHCGVSNIIGIDPLLPNTQLHRLKVSYGPQALLIKTIPNFRFHIPHMGIQTSATSSRDEEDEAHTLGSSYYNIVERYSPTHIVHLVSVNSPYVYTRRSAAGPREGRIMDHTDLPLRDSILWNSTTTTTTSSEEASYWWSVYGPNRPINMIRQNRFAMEHLLKSVSQVQWKRQLMELQKKQHQSSLLTTTPIDSATTPDSSTTTTTTKSLMPRLIYVSCNADDSSLGLTSSVLGLLPKVQDALAASYADKHNVSSVGLRFGTVYGPWDHFLTPMYQMAERAIKPPERPVLLPSIAETKDEQQDFVHVSDAISAIVSAMQLDLNELPQTKEKLNVIFRMDTGERQSLYKVSKIMEEVFPRSITLLAANRSVIGPGILPDEKDDQEELSHWKPRIPFSMGIRRLLSWHYELAYMYGPNRFESPLKSKQQKSVEKSIHDRGLALLQSSSTGIGGCSSKRDATCLRGLLTSRIPCSSECTMSSSLCTPSMFDSVLDVIREATNGCSSILYTISLGRNDDSIPHRLGPNDPHFDGVNVCNIVFISRDSPLALKIVRSIPVDGDVNYNATGSDILSEQEVEVRLQMYNCKVETDGWTTCWVPTNETATSVSNEMSMLKLSPGRFFSSSVKYAMFVDATFPVLPTQDDVEFLLSEVYREAQPERTVTYRLDKPKSAGDDGKAGAPQIVYKYKIPPQPARRSILFVSPVRIPDERIRLSVHTAMKLMLEEIEQYEESDSLRLQRFFYESMPRAINKGEQRSFYEPLHKYTHTPFYVRSKWIIHDMTLEEARQLRCDWFQEHSSWGNELDSFSLAAVLAQRDIVRRIKWSELDQRALDGIPEIPEKITDDNDWKMVWTDDSRFLTSKAKDRSVDASAKGKAGLYVRIINDDEMLNARKQWVARSEGLE